MKKNNNNIGSFIKLHDEEFLNNQRIAGKVVADTLTLLENEVKNKTKLSLIELNKLGEEFIYSHDGCTPTFKGYRSFPNGICISVKSNSLKEYQLVHGIAIDYVLQEGDLVSFDLGATYKEAIADSAITCIYGAPNSDQDIEIVDVCNNALYEGIKAVSIGKQVGVIGNAINKYITSKSNFKVITNYGGHGISIDNDGKGVPHAPPFIANKAKINEGIRICAGMSLAIEPLICVKDPETKVLSDNWTVITPFGMNAHFEHTIFVHNDSVEIITWREQDIKNKYTRKIKFN